MIHNNQIKKVNISVSSNTNHFYVQIISYYFICSSIYTIDCFNQYLPCCVIGKQDYCPHSWAPPSLPFVPCSSHCSTPSFQWPSYHMPLDSSTRLICYFPPMSENLHNCTKIAKGTKQYFVYQIFISLSCV